MSIGSSLEIFQNEDNLIMISTGYMGTHTVSVPIIGTLTVCVPIRLDISPNLEQL